MLRVGLTGGIACGKSTVLARLRERGLATLDLDRVARDVMAPGGSAYGDVAAAFGPGILAPDGTIDRPALAGVVFADPAARARLDSLVHPRVREEEARRAAAFEAEGRELLVSDAALLVEAGMHLRYQRLVVVHCPPDEQLRRLAARDGLSEDDARARLDAQMPIGEKRRYAHLEVDTSGSLADTGEAAEILAGALITEAGAPRPTGSLVPGRALGGLQAAGARGPRGLSPRVALEAFVASGGVDMRALAERLEPAGTGPWYRAARQEEVDPWPEALALSLALWTVGAGADEEWLVGAAASLARLTHGDGESVAGAVLAALLAHGVARSGRLRVLEDRAGEREARARRWGGAHPAWRVRAATEAARAHPGDPGAAGSAAAQAGGEPGFAASLVGMALGSFPAGPDPSLVALVQRLG